MNGSNPHGTPNFVLSLGTLRTGRRRSSRGKELSILFVSHGDNLKGIALSRLVDVAQVFGQGMDTALVVVDHDKDTDIKIHADRQDGMNGSSIFGGRHGHGLQQDAQGHFLQVGCLGQGHGPVPPHTQVRTRPAQGGHVGTGTGNQASIGHALNRRIQKGSGGSVGIQINHIPRGIRRDQAFAKLLRGSTVVQFGCGVARLNPNTTTSSTRTSVLIRTITLLLLLWWWILRLAIQLFVLQVIVGEIGACPFNRGRVQIVNGDVMDSGNFLPIPQGS